MKLPPPACMHAPATASGTGTGTGIGRNRCHRRQWHATASGTASGSEREVSMPLSHCREWHLSLPVVSILFCVFVGCSTVGTAVAQYTSCVRTAFSFSLSRCIIQCFFLCHCHMILSLSFQLSSSSSSYFRYCTVPHICRVHCMPATNQRWSPVYRLASLDASVNCIIFISSRASTRYPWPWS